MKVTVVFSAYNEGKTIREIVKKAKEAKLVDEILVVDGYSDDNTVEESMKGGAKVVYQYEKKYPGKGIAIKTARNEAKGDILVFFDADVGNFEGRMLDRLVKPILDKKCDHTIANFVGRRGRVTELVVKPLLKIFFPEVKFNNPLAGEFALKKKILFDIEIPDDWGIETALVIDVTMKGYKSKEINFKGEKSHDAKPVEKLVIMSRQIIDTFISKITEYNRVLKGIKKTEKLPENLLEELKKEVIENINNDVPKNEIDKYFSKINEDIYRISSLENL
jgi:glycosyltransferase involved in cell wall biosynthesis|tara:strand:+ start:400 stop:1230 length:831 start_codon:yes stop_codon:yes gene_type:complete